MAIEASYNALESGQVHVQVVFTTDGQLLGGKFKVLGDFAKHVFGFQNMRPDRRQESALRTGTGIRRNDQQGLQAADGSPAIQQMNKAVSVGKAGPPSAVAKQFLSANGLGS